MRDDESAAGEPGERSEAALRLLRENDADDVVGLYRTAFGEGRPIDREEVLSWVRNPELKPEWLRVLELGGRVVGYGDIWIENDVVALDIAAPGHWQTFLGWAEDSARAAAVPRVRVYFPAGHELAGLVERRGYRLWRSSYTMQIELGDAVAGGPHLPEGIELRPYRPGDEDLLRAALNEAFADDPFFGAASASHFREFYLRARGFEPSLWLLAWADAELAGFVLAFPERAGDPSLGWVESLGVRRPWRRRGLGEALLCSAFAELRERGVRAAGLGVDAQNETGALRLYERVGMRVVRRGDNWVLDL